MFSRGWKFTEQEAPAHRQLSFDDFFEGSDLLPDLDYKDFFDHVTSQLNDHHILYDLVISRKKGFPVEGVIDPTGRSYLVGLSVSGPNPLRVTLKNMDIADAHLRGAPTLTFINCKIADLRIWGVNRDNTDSIFDHEGIMSCTFINCEIGMLRLGPRCLSELSMKNCKLYEINVPQVGPGQNPFWGPVQLINTRFSRSNDFLSDEQQYRKLRQHLLDVGNTRAAGEALAAELIAERPSEPLPNRLFSFAYQAISDFGNSLGRPLIWWLLGGLATFVAYLLTNQAAPLRALDYQGWQIVLLSPDLCGRILRSGVLSIGTMVDPLGIGDIGKLSIPTDLYGAVINVMHRMLSTACIVSFLLALRRRFKMS